MYSASSIIQTSIIWRLNYPDAKFHKPHPHYKSHVGLGDCKILQNGVFQSSKATRSAENILIIKEKLDICRLMVTDRFYTEHYGSRRSTTVAKSWMILEENGRHRWILLIRTNSLIGTLLKSTMTEGVWIWGCTVPSKNGEMQKKQTKKKCCFFLYKVIWCMYKQSETTTWMSIVKLSVTYTHNKEQYIIHQYWYKTTNDAGITQWHTCWSD